jgi:hypothetical protein
VTPSVSAQSPLCMTTTYQTDHPWLADARNGSMHVHIRLAPGPCGHDKVRLLFFIFSHHSSATRMRRLFYFCDPIKNYFATSSKHLAVVHVHHAMHTLHAYIVYDDIRVFPVV